MAFILDSQGNSRAASRELRLRVFRLDRKSSEPSLRRLTFPQKETKDQGADSVSKRRIKCFVQ